MIEDKAEEIKKYVSDNVKNKTYINFDILTGKDQIIKLKDFNNEYDARLKDIKYLEKSFTITMFINKTMQTIGKATFFVIDYYIWKEVFFWKQYGEILRKETMESLLQDRDKKCIIMGYGQISNSIQTHGNFLSKGKIMEYYYSVLQFLLQRSKGSMLYCEPCGYYSLSNQIMEQNELKLSNFNFKNIGRVCPESVVSEKIVKQLHFNKFESCYHSSTLGPIYYKYI